MINNFLNPKGHLNPTSGSKVSAILQKGWIWPTGGVASGEGPCLQAAQQACFVVVITLKMSKNLYAVSKRGSPKIVSHLN